MSSNSTAIKVQNLSKRYRIGLREQMHDSIGGALLDFVKRPINNYRKYRSLYKFDTPGTCQNNGRENGDSDIIWALTDVSFEVKQGEVLGIVGGNGAGKSTLLKILSRITEPTGGNAEIHGRISSLLEVGTGFHPELTGRENVFLNGTILGMTKREIESKFDEIIEFSGIEKFLDTPVKRYSSGMIVRLAFSVAAHLEPEVLIIDEVLAVGDAQFQKKCIGKMNQVASEGRTVLFVSHNMAAITQLCSRALLLEKGIVKHTGAPSEVVSSYLKSDSIQLGEWRNSSPPSDKMELQISWARVLSSENQVTGIVTFSEGFSIEIGYHVLQPIIDSSILFRLNDLQGNILWTTWDTDTTSLEGATRNPGHHISKVTIPGSLVKPGRYTVSIGALIKYVKVLDSHANILEIQVSEVNYPFASGRVGAITPLFDWEVTKNDEA